MALLNRIAVEDGRLADRRRDDYTNPVIIR